MVSGTHLAPALRACVLRDGESRQSRALERWLFQKFDVTGTWRPAAKRGLAVLYSLRAACCPQLPALLHIPPQRTGTSCWAPLGHGRTNPAPPRERCPPCRVRPRPARPCLGPPCLGPAGVAVRTGDRPRPRAAWPPRPAEVSARLSREVTEARGGPGL